MIGMKWDSIKDKYRDTYFYRMAFNIKNFFVYHFGICKYNDAQKNFISLNRMVWMKDFKCQVQSKNKRIVLVHCTVDSPDAFWDVMKRAEIYKIKYGYEIWVVLRGHFKDNGNIASVYGSFDIDKTIYFDGYNRFFEVLKEKCIAKKMCKRYIQNINIDSFITFSVMDVRIGDLIYDTIQASHNLSTITKIKREYNRIIREAFRELVFYSNTFQDNDVIAYLTNEYDYLNGISVRTAVKHCKDVICIDGYGYKKYNESNIYDSQYSLIGRITKTELEAKLKINSEFRAACEEYFNSRTNGYSKKFGGMEAYKKDQFPSSELRNRLGIINDKPTVLVAAHVFSDAGHMYEQWVFRDYFEWLQYTLVKLSRREDLNVLLKLHPCEREYMDDGIERIYSICEGSVSIKIVPKEVSTLSVLYISDVVLTCGGTIGLEATCLGIPSVNLCQSHYYGFGLVREIRDIKCYEKYIDEIQDLEKSDDKDKKILAKAILYLISNNEKKSPIKLVDYPILTPGEIVEKTNIQYSYLNSKIVNICNIKDEQYNEWYAEE